MALTTLDTCFADGKLQIVEPSKQKAKDSLNLAREYLVEARKSLSVENNRLAMNGVYFVWFHAARAVLFRDGIREKSHYCLQQYLETYVTNGCLDRKWITLFGRMRKKREDSQYSLNPPPLREETESVLGLTEEFIEKISGMIE
jgi:uncharacterized protein (UPF0332 family)